MYHNYIGIGTRFFYYKSLKYAKKEIFIILTKKVIIIGAGVSGLCIGALLVKHGLNVEIYEKMSKVGGRTVSTIFKNHILDNGFHIMPFYKKSSLYKVLKILNIHNLLKLSKVTGISFYHENKFYKYPKGLLDFLTLSLLPFRNRLEVLKLILPMAFASIKQSEKRPRHRRWPAAS